MTTIEHIPTHTRTYARKHTHTFMNIYKGLFDKDQNRIANSIDPDEMAHN